MVMCSVYASLDNLTALVVSDKWQKPSGPAVGTDIKLYAGK